MNVSDTGELVLIYETEKACLARLIHQGFGKEAATQIAAYLEQSTSLAEEFDAIGRACAARGLLFSPVDLDEAPFRVAACDPRNSLVWTLTDGIAYFRGSAGPALARLNNLATFGADDSLFALAQDKFRSGSVLAALGAPVPAAGLARDGRWIVAPPRAKAGYFVKPNRLGAKIGLWTDSHCHDEGQALELSRRIAAAYRDDAIVQRYVPGRNVRVSFLGVDPDAGAEALGVFFVDSGGDFQTMEDSLSLSGEGALEALARGDYAEPELVPVATTQPDADRRIRNIVAELMNGLGLRDVFSLDFRVEADNSVHLLEFEVCPGLPSFDFRSYCRSQWDLSLPDAMAEAAARLFARLSRVQRQVRPAERTDRES